MHPAAAVAAGIFRTLTRATTVGKIDRDQAEDYARCKRPALSRER
jgi:hypothetical protein